MSILRVASFSISIDGYGAGPDQSMDEPLGVGGESLHEWLIATRTFQDLIGNEGGSEGTDNDFASSGLHNIGAWIMGRNMFGPVRGMRPDDSWKGWWGDNPPYHGPVYVLSHRPQEPIRMDGGTTFIFVTDGIYSALDRAKEAAGGRDIRLLGGVATIRQFLREGLIDELHIAVAPILLGSGESLWADLDVQSLGYRVAGHVPTQLATHIVLRKAS